MQVPPRPRFYFYLKNHCIAATQSLPEPLFPACIFIKLPADRSVHDFSYTLHKYSIGIYYKVFVFFFVFYWAFCFFHGFKDTQVLQGIPIFSQSTSCLNNIINFPLGFIHDLKHQNNKTYSNTSEKGFIWPVCTPPG